MMMNYNQILGQSMGSGVSNFYNSYLMIFFKGNSFVDYACCSCEHALKNNFCKHYIAILLKFLPDYRESSILEHCETYYDIQHGDLEALYLYSKPHKINNFEEELDEDAGGHVYVEGKNNDIDNEKIKYT